MNGSYNKRVDANQKEIVKALKEHGWDSIDLHALGGGVPDILAVRRTGYNWDDGWNMQLIEVKSEKGTYTKAEKEFMEKYPGLVTTIRSKEDVDGLG